MNPYLKHIPVGEPLPLHNLHAVSVSLPTMQDVIGYEENDPSVTGKMLSGYPRFFMNKLVEKLCSHLREKHHIPGTTEILPLMSEAAYHVVTRRFGESIPFIEESGCVFLVCEHGNIRRQEIKDFIRHTGILLSSRKAEDTLLSLGLIPEIQFESIHHGHDPDRFIRTALCNAYGARSTDHVFLCASGMNAVYAVFEAIVRINRPAGKRTIVQAGWLYLDTLEIIRKYSSDHILLTSVTDLNALEDWIVRDHHAIGAVFTEVPNNPLLECPDLPRLYALCQKYGIPLIADATIGTAHNLNILSCCDIAVESLTKFACGQGDVLMGAIIVNPAGSMAGAFEKTLLQDIVHPYERDLQRHACSVEGYEDRVGRISANTRRVIAYLETSPAVSHIHSVLHPDSYQNFLKIRKHPDALPGLISVVFRKGLARHYDLLNLPKGPSLGTEFTLAMPYVYLAHYDKVKTPEGREELMKMGLHPELLRISVGTEPVEEIISALQNAGI